MTTTLDDVREIAMALPGVTEAVSGYRTGMTWRTRTGVFVWERGPSKTDLAQLEEAGRSWPDGIVVGIRTDGLEDKEALLAALPRALFTIPHFDGYPAVLCRLDRIDRAQLTELVTDAWLTRAPKRIAAQWLAEHGLEEPES